MKQVLIKLEAVRQKTLGFFALAMLLASNSFAQGSGVGGIGAGTTALGTYVDPVSNLILAIGAVVGLVGGIRVYIKWNSGDQDVNKELMGWMGSCIFLVMVSIIIKAFFVAG